MQHRFTPAQQPPSCPGSREDSNYFDWIVTDRDLNLFGQCVACGQDIPLEINRWAYYILAEHTATAAPAPTAATRKAQLEVAR